MQIIPLEGYKVRAVYNPTWGAIELYLYRDLGNGQHVIVESSDAPMLERMFDGYARSFDVKPTFVLDKAEAQAIVEALAAEGIHADNDAKIAGTLEATRAHLNDLRAMLKLDKTEGAQKK